MFTSSPQRPADQRSADASTFVLTASVDETLAVAVVLALEASNATELDEHQKHWRKNIWRGSAAAHATIDAQGLPASSAKKTVRPSYPR